MKSNNNNKVECHDTIKKIYGKNYEDMTSTPTINTKPSQGRQHS